MVTPWVGRGPFRGRGPFKGRGPFAGQGSPFGRLTGSVWTPARLFAASEVGAWYDPSDLTTLFQDAAGSTPVTAVEQPVGLMLDKSKGGRQALGTTGWVKNSGDGVVTVVGNVITITGATTTTRVDLASPGWALGDYGDVTVTGNVGGATSPLVYVGLGNPYSSVSGTNTFRNIISSGVILRLQIGAGSATFTVTSCGRVPGNHASQTTSTSRPTLSARYNLLTYSEQFDNAAWTKIRSTVTANTSGTTDPLGGNTADKLVEDTTASNDHFVGQTITTSASGHTWSVYLKAAERTWAALYSQSGHGRFFNLATGQVGGVGTWTAPTSSSIVSAGNGWYLCSITVPLAAQSNLMRVFTATADATSAYTGDGTSGIYVWGADLRVANEPAALPAYQRVTTSTDYDTVGFPPYLRFDGVDDSMVTASIDMTSTANATVFAGLRKLSDAAVGVYAETSADAASNAGAFRLSAPSAAGANNYGALYRTATGPNSGTYVTYTAPSTDVLATRIFATGDGFAGAFSTRIDSALVAGTAAANSGTGTNFGNYVLNIGSRSGTQRFNGRLYSLIVRGAATSDADIVNAENWVETKTFGKDMNIVYVDEVTIGPTNELVTIGPSAEQVYVYQQYV